MLELKKLSLTAVEFAVGDLVVTKMGDNAYFIQKITKTLLHKHCVFHTVYLFGCQNDVKFYEHEIHGRRTVYRFSRCEKEKQ
jgi:hypothetical protein